MSLIKFEAGESDNETPKEYQLCGVFEGNFVDIVQNNQGEWHGMYKNHTVTASYNTRTEALKHTESILSIWSDIELQLNSLPPFNEGIAKFASTLSDNRDYSSLVVLKRLLESNETIRYLQSVVDMLASADYEVK